MKGGKPRCGAVLQTFPRVRVPAQFRLVPFKSALRRVLYGDDLVGRAWPGRSLIEP